MKNYFMKIISRILSFIGEILRKSAEAFLRNLEFCKKSRFYPIPIKDLRGNPKPRVSPDRTGPDRTGPKPVRGRGTVLRIFSGRVGLGNFISGRSGSGNFISGPSRSGYFLPGYETFSPGISGINLPFIPN